MPVVLRASLNTVKSEVLRSLYLLYWYKSTNTGARERSVQRITETPAEAARSFLHMQFACFTGTKVQILTLGQRAADYGDPRGGRAVDSQFTRFTGTTVQILTPEKRAADYGDPRRGRAVVSAYAVYLLYWYRSTNTDARKARSRLRRPPQMPCGRFCMRAARSGYSVYLLY
jgi:hypothetical protein